MQASITYTEISNYIKAHYDVRPEFSPVNENILKVEWHPAPLVPSVSAELHIDSCTTDEVRASIQADGATGTILEIAKFFGKKTGFLDRIKDYLPAGVDLDTANNRLVAHLRQIEALQKPLTYADLASISFAHDSVVLTARLK